MDGFLDCILMETVSILLLGGLGEVSDLLAFVSLKIGVPVNPYQRD